MSRMFSGKHIEAKKAAKADSVESHSVGHSYGRAILLKEGHLFAQGGHAKSVKITLVACNG
ncbi:MAG: hypothetical protein NPIRA06_18520 [Nitrospirales bacterium]|nr:MAG: hypothetical protein NPIRA06_18520 [Nitrospirales bacterium]